MSLAALDWAWKARPIPFFFRYSCPQVLRMVHQQWFYGDFQPWSHREH